MELPHDACLEEARKARFSMTRNWLTSADVWRQVMPVRPELLTDRKVPCMKLFRFGAFSLRLVESNEVVESPGHLRVNGPKCPFHYSQGSLIQGRRFLMSVLVLIESCQVVKNAG